MLDVSHVNLIAILVATVIGIAIGFFWYSSRVFGQAWARFNEFTAEDINPNPWLYLINFVATLIMAYVLAQFVFFFDANNATEGALVGFWTWFGFTFTTSLIDYIFTGRSMKAYAITYGYQLVSMVVMGGILAVWR